VKASVDRAETRRVLAGIDQVLRGRTADAVDRVLATAAPGMRQSMYCYAEVTRPLCLELGIKPVPIRSTDCNVPFCEWCDDEGKGYLDILPLYVGCRDHVHGYAPWIVSPHLFPLDP